MLPETLKVDASTVDLSQFYWIIGAIVVTYAGSIIAAAWAAIKLSFKAGSYKRELEQRDEDAKNCAVRAHKRLDDIEGKRRDEV